MYTLSEILRGKPNARQHEDLRILRSFVEYKEGSDKMDYIIIEMEMKDRDGSSIHMFKAIKLYRIIKLPDTLKQSLAMMDIQSQILASFWEGKINFISMITRIEDCGTDTPIGLMQIFGVQGVARTIQEAKEIADCDFQGLTAAIQGSYRTMEFRMLNTKESEWMREKMANMKHIQVIRGIPQARKSPSERSIKGFGGSDTTPTSEETTEQFAAGLAEHEFIALTLSSPIEYDVLENWLTQTTKKQTYWASVMQGTTSMNAGINIPVVFAANLGSSLGTSDGVSDSVSEGRSTNTSTSTSVSESISRSHGFSQGTSIGTSESFGQNMSISHSEGESMTHTIGHTEGVSFGESENFSVSTGHSQGISENFGTSESVSSSQSSSQGFSQGLSQNHSQGSSQGHSTSQNLSQSHSLGSSSTTSGSASLSVGGSAGVNLKLVNASKSVTGTVGVSHGISSSETSSAGISTGESLSNGTSQSDSWGQSTSNSNSLSNSFGRGSSTSHGQGTSESWSQSSSQGRGLSRSVSSSDSESFSQGRSVSDGWSKGVSYGTGRSQTQSASESYSVSRSNGVSRGVSRGEGESWGRSIGRSSSVNNSLSQGFSSSMGVGASLGVGKSYQFIDKEVENIVELLEFQKLRLKKSIHGGTGAFFVDMYVATESKEAKNAARTAAKFSWYDENALICPLQVLELEEEENDHLLYHFNAFSACTMREMDRYGELESYKYTTILNSDELTAYTHIIRLSDGGIYADIQNIPELAVPSEMHGEIYIGKILSGYRWTPESGYKTKFDYRIPEATMMHGLFCGGSRSGKSVTALRFTAELANKVRRGPKKKRMRIVAMDPKYDWRKLARYVEPERFRIYSMGDPKKFPFKLNPLKVPMGVDPEFHLDTLIDVFCRAYGLGVRSVTILLDTLKTLYDKQGVFDTEDPIEISERSARITIADAYNFLNQKKENKEFGRDKSDAVDKVLDRLGRYAWKNGVLYKLYCQPDGMSIDEILGQDDVVVLESGKIQSNNMAFIFGFITASIYMYAKYLPNYFNGDEQFETCLIIEEANRVLTGESGDSNGGIQGQSIFEEMLDQAAGMGLFVFSITQQPSLMPNSILANSGLVFAGKLTLEDDVTSILTSLGRDPKFDDRNVKKFFPKMPIGWFVIKNSRGFDYKESEAVLVAVDGLDVETPTDEELIQQMETYQLRKESNQIIEQYKDQIDINNPTPY
ncbi:serine-rich protein [Alkaliphilus sp. B6464]|uniref:serine-rich protein n=1 Tax=Alkaliphilus sp. B6464 TaxID=2731219 RepID=UPI001BA59493|nr:serine-rich protein [Alkaliphilus sp. B6464]QUH22029.1 ATP-binding protein [Alkaliphilus sp. B6464]